jgi:SAM-dependent methyltransferase
MSEGARSLYDAPALYAMLYDGWTADLDFYRSLAATARGDVLECGIGTGRVALDLARRGHRVHGVDVEAAMLERLALTLRGEPALVDRVTFERADVRTMDLGRRFPLVIAPFNGVAHQRTPDELRAFFSGVARHLAPGGVFAFDSWIVDDAQKKGRVSDSPRFRDPRSGEPLRCTETVRWDESTRTLHVTFDLHHLDRDAPERLALQLRVVEPIETRALLAAAGFRSVEDVDLGEMRGWRCAIAPIATQV